MNGNKTLGNTLLNWYYKFKRDLPWRETKDPYLIWISEIILQQTQVKQGLSYYIKFANAFKNVFELANAEPDQVFKLWQGLGYYSRAGNMHAAAKQIVKQYNGVFPNSAAELKKLKGIGNYTAAAIASICFNERVAVVDGNVYRVISRLFGISAPIGSNASYIEFANQSMKMMPKESPGDYNQAIMELGAVVCLPHNPACADCPLQNHCVAFRSDTQQLLPVKLKISKPKKRYLYYVVIQKCNSIYMKRRLEKDIWRNLFDFPLIESNVQLSEKQMFNLISKKFEVNQRNCISFSPEIVHKLSHQTLIARFVHYNVNEVSKNVLKLHTEIPLKELENTSVPKLIENYLKNEFGFEK